MGLFPVENALKTILEGVVPLSEEDVAIEEAIGRALAKSVVAARTLPPWDNSAMDGYAVRSADATGAGVRLKIVDRIFAGDHPTRPIGPGECARIMTGAPLPPGSDAVLMQERTAADGDQVELHEAVPAKSAVRFAGEDTRKGQLLLAAGTVIGIPEAGLLWSQGLTRVTVRRRPRVAIASTGDELCPVGEEPDDRIFDTNSPSIAAAVRRAGGLPTLLGLAPDRLEEVKALFARGLEFDVLITSAGASVGERDFAKEALEAIGVQMDFWKVAMKPGKPLAVGHRGATRVFGLPGNPTSSLVSFELFVRPALRALQGLPSAPAELGGKIAVALKKAPGLRHFVRATVALRDGELWATPLSTQSSGALSSAASATHLISVPPEVTVLSPGDAITLIPVSWAG
jgi:molybdopterin molybdotransferase